MARDETSRDIPKGVIVVNCFSHVASAKFEIFFRSKKHSIFERVSETNSNRFKHHIAVELTAEMYTVFRHFLILKLFYIFLFVIDTLCNTFSCL